MTPGGATLVVLGVAVLANVWVHVGARRSHVWTGPLVAVALVLVARLAGLSWGDLGLSPAALPSGLLFGTAASALVVGLQVAAAGLPRLRPLFLDARWQMPVRSAGRVALLRVPLATVVPEEVVFRSVLWGLLEHDHGALRATLVSSVLFGFWHVLPALDLLRTSTVTVGRADGRRALLTIAGTVLFTTVAGVVFAELRRRSGSVVAPMCLHWATNGCAVVLAARAWADQPGPSPTAPAERAENS